LVMISKAPEGRSVLPQPDGIDERIAKLARGQGCKQAKCESLNTPYSHGVAGAGLSWLQKERPGERKREDSRSWEMARGIQCQLAETHDGRQTSLGRPDPPF